MGDTKNHISVRIDKGIYSILKQISAETDVPISKLIARAVREMIWQSEEGGEIC